MFFLQGDDKAHIDKGNTFCCYCPWKDAKNSGWVQGGGIPQ